jgi:enoyl-CoA hydratase/carnithine racemase
MIGSELALAADMRFASREKAIISQFEVGAGYVPGGGPMVRLSRLGGRNHARDILIGADDSGGGPAERHGYVNRALPDAELDGSVDALANPLRRSINRQSPIPRSWLISLAYCGTRRCSRDGTPSSSRYCGPGLRRGGSTHQ